MAAPPLTDYTLRCDCGRSYCHAIHFAELMHECFAENPQDHLCSQDLCPEELEDAPEGPEEDPLLCLQDCDNECNPQECDSMILVCICRLQSPQCGVPRCYRWYSDGG